MPLEWNPQGQSCISGGDSTASVTKTDNKRNEMSQGERSKGGSGHGQLTQTDDALLIVSEVI